MGWDGKLCDRKRVEEETSTSGRDDGMEHDGMGHDGTGGDRECHGKGFDIRQGKGRGHHGSGQDMMDWKKRKRVAK